MSAQHTPGPWEAVGNVIRTTFAHGDPEQRGWLVAECAIGSIPGKDNAAHIVQCVNKHDGLIELLRICAEVLKRVEPSGDQASDEILSGTIAAIAKATGSTA